MSKKDKPKDDHGKFSFKVVIDYFCRCILVLGILIKLNLKYMSGFVGQLTRWHRFVQYNYAIIYSV